MSGTVRADSLTVLRGYSPFSKARVPVTGWTYLSVPFLGNRREGPFRTNLEEVATFAVDDRRHRDVIDHEHVGARDRRRTPAALSVSLVSSSTSPQEDE
jgi:hypothetical protein